jgi:uncharacterized cupin superfamily protein
MSVGCDEIDETALDEEPSGVFRVGAVVAEQARRVYLEEPAPLGPTSCEIGVLDDRVRPLGMREHRCQSGSLDLLREPFRECHGARERKLHQDGREVAEAITTQIILEQRRRRRELEPEPEIETLLGEEGRHLRVRAADRVLPLVRKRKLGPDVRRRKEHARAMGSGVAAEPEALLYAPHPVVLGWDHVRVDVDEHVLHPSGRPRALYCGTVTALSNERSTMVAEAKPVATEAGLIPKGDGWFVVNAREALWEVNDVFGRNCGFEDPERRFTAFGFNIGVLEPGQPNCMYHGENEQEDFLILAGECLLLIEGEERRLRPWDFVHCPPWTEHVFVGAGERPCVIIAVGTRGGEGVRYPAVDVALRHAAGVETETSSANEAYAQFPGFAATPYREGDLPDC